jgi:hypothetical protein
MKPQVQPDYWRDRSKEARTSAEAMSDPVARNMMLRLADSYELMALQAETRARRRDLSQ